MEAGRRDIRLIRNAGEISDDHGRTCETTRRRGYFDAEGGKPRQAIRPDPERERLYRVHQKHR